MSYTKTTWVNNTTPINETNLNKIESGIKNNDINIGEENYDNTKTYEVGDIVRYNEKIYKCITAITTAENFDISKWEQTNIVEIVQSEKSKIYELIEAISTPIVGEGENITLNDTAEKRFENFDIEGNSEQEATPSPDYPSPIKTVGSNVNLFNKETVTKGKYMMNGTIGTNSNYVYSDYIEIGANQDFIWNTSDGTIGTFISYYNSSKTYISGTSSVNNISKTTPENCKYIIVSFDMRFLDIAKIEKGSIATEYSEYGQGCINEVICNKNLFDKNTTTDGKYIDGNGSIQTQSNIMYSDYIQIKTNINYYITGRSEWASVALYDKNKTFLERISTTQPNGVLNITNSNCKYIIINALLTDKDTLQIEEGSTVTPYEEHQSQSYTIPTQQPMRSIGDIRDIFILKENGKWYERHYIGRYILDGTEDWLSKQTSDSSIRFQSTALPSNCGKTNIGYSNYFKVQSEGISSYDNGISVYESNATIYVWILKTIVETVEEFKTLLAEQYNAGTPVYIDYVLETPIDIECTSEQTEILNQIYIKAKSYKGVTHIYSNDAVSPNCYVEAVKDLTTLIQ